MNYDEFWVKTLDAVRGLLQMGIAQGIAAEMPLAAPAIGNEPVGRLPA